MLRRRTRWLLRNFYRYSGLRWVGSAFFDGNDRVLGIGYGKCVYIIEKGHYEFTLVTINSLGFCVSESKSDREREKERERERESLMG
jgi:hypothetical protein